LLAPCACARLLLLLLLLPALPPRWQLLALLLLRVPGPALLLLRVPGPALLLPGET
jgi:hypothetical protein